MDYACEGQSGNNPIWAIGWDRRSLRLKLLENGKWSTYLLLKASYCNDASHGWYTAWPRIREITAGRWTMDVHGMFFDFPPTFSRSNSAGIRPIASHSKRIADYCSWNGLLVLTGVRKDAPASEHVFTNSTAEIGLWFGGIDDLAPLSLGTHWILCSAFGSGRNGGRGAQRRRGAEKKGRREERAQRGAGGEAAGRLSVSN